MSVHNKARPKTRPKARRALALAIVAAAVMSAVAIVAYREAGDPRFALADIAVTGEHETSRADILSAAALARGANVWLLDVGSAERRVEGLPWIAGASVRRTWPNRVSLAVTERSPVARIFIPDLTGGEEPRPGTALIDATMRVLALLAVPSPGGAPKNELVARANRLPLIRITPQPSGVDLGGDVGDVDVQQAYDSMVELRALGLHISEVDLRPSTGITVTCDGGLRVIFGTDSDLATKVSYFRAIVPKIRAPERVVYVDLRSVRAPTVLYR